MIDLTRQKWQVKGFFPWIPYKDKSMETGKDLMGVTDWIDARVPGGVHFDLFRAGLIEDPYRDLDSRKCEWVENRWWMYRTEIGTTELRKGCPKLVFEGIDDRADIFIDQERVAQHEGMYSPVIVDLAPFVHDREKLTLQILLHHAPDEMAQIGWTSRTKTQKSRFNYKWDFATRLVNLGIWKKVFIDVQDIAVLNCVHVVTDVQNGRGLVSFSANVQRNIPGDEFFEAECTFAGHGTDVSLRLPVVGGRISGSFEVSDPHLWYPNGYGNQPLYAFSLKLACSGRILDVYSLDIGLRRLAWLPNVTAPTEALPYTFIVNGQHTYIKGVNMTPLDHVYGNVTETHYEHMVMLMKRMNVNLVRIWGGGIIEQDSFYRLCTKNGIMVWQEMIQSSSGLDNIPSKDPHFLNLLRDTAVNVVLGRRNHTCLAAWGGGNELMDENNVPATYADENISILKTIIERHDPQHIFYPTSSTGPNEFVNWDRDVSFDTHGHWNYQGNPVHYALYEQSDNLFHSEFGAEGMCSMNSLQKFVSPEWQTIASTEDNTVYRHHGEWWCCLKRDDALFGERKNMREFVCTSRWIHAEALRYILEADKRKKPRNSGTIIWQINEPWPNVSCTSLVDFYQETKPAYSWTQRAYAHCGASLQYEKLNWEPGEKFSANVWTWADIPAVEGDCRVRVQAVKTNGTVVYEQQYTGTVDIMASACLGELSFIFPDLHGELLVIRMQAEFGDHLTENEYYFGSGEKPYASALRMPSAVLKSRKISDDGCYVVYEVFNDSTVSALHVETVCKNGFDIIPERAYRTLLPGERAEFAVIYSRKFSSGFLMNEESKDAEPQIAFTCLNGEDA